MKNSAQQAKYEGAKLNIEDVDMCCVVPQQQGTVFFSHQRPGVLQKTML